MGWYAQAIKNEAQIRY